MKTNTRNKLAIAAAALVLLYAIAGFFVLPAVVRPKIVEAVREATHREATIAGLSLNPFTLSATIDSFELKDTDGERLVSFNRLHVNYELVSLFKGAYVLSEFHLDTPYVSFRLMGDGRSSVHDLTESGPDSADSPGEPTKPIVIEDFRLRDGAVHYTDLSRTPALAKSVDSLNLSLKNFTTIPNEEGLYEFTASSGRGGTLHWKGTVSVAPPKSEGEFELRNILATNLWDFMSDRFKFRVDGGILDFRGGYTFDASGRASTFRLRDGRAGVAGLVIGDPNDSIAPLVIPRADVLGIGIDYPSMAVTIDRIGLKGASVRTAYLPDSTMSLTELLKPIAGPADTAPSRMTLLVTKITASGTSFTFLDRLAEPEASTALSALELEIGNLTYNKPGVATVKAAGVLNGAGTLGAEGTFSLEPMKADLALKVDGTPFAAVQPYSARYNRARFESGTISTTGTMSYADSAGLTLFRYTGGVSLDSVRISDPLRHEDLTRWERLELKGIDFTLLPRRLAIKEIVARRPYIRAIVNPDRTTNFNHVFSDSAALAAMAVADSVAKLKKERGDDEDAGDKAAPAGTADTSTAGPTGTAGTPGTPGTPAAPQTATRIGAIRIVDGTMNFSDLSLTPNFIVSIQEMGGKISGLSSEEVARADVDITGKVDKYAPVTISGQINPLSEEAYTDILLKFQGIELTTFTPYSGKFMGYKIDRGKLSLDLRYKLNKRHLDGENKIVLDQLTLGEEVEGPDVTSLPVKLVIALLKDSRGVIDLDIPVSGSLDDPDFSVIPIVFKVLLNVCTKAVMAPFALIGGLFGGGGEDLEHVGFVPGTDSLEADQLPGLETVAKGLTERPALQLDIRGSASPAADGEAIRLAAIAARVHPGRTGAVTRADDERVLQLYEETFRDDADKLVPDEGMEDAAREKAIFDAALKRLTDSVQVSANDLRTLAQRRAAAVTDYLARVRGIDPARLFLQEVDTAVEPEEGRVRTALTLTAR